MIQRFDIYTLVLFSFFVMVFAVPADAKTDGADRLSSPDRTMPAADSIRYVSGDDDFQQDESEESPQRIRLFQNYPNPFNPLTTIRFQLDQPRQVRLEIFDQLGRRVDEIVNEVRPAGEHEFFYNASHLTSGVYMYRMKIPGSGDSPAEVHTRKFTLLK